jgi:hypothetical protein
MENELVFYPWEIDASVYGETAAYGHADRLIDLVVTPIEPRPSMEMAISAFFSTAVKSMGVNCDPWSVLKMPGNAIAGATVFEAIGDHWRAIALQRSIIFGIGPEPGCLRGSGSWCKRRQCRLVGEDPITFPDLGEVGMKEYHAFEMRENS